jgi:CheY-like chemotaxis protein
MGSRQLQGRAKDTSAGGAKILLKERLPLGTQVGLQFRPPGRVPVETHALVWRLDADGFACVFVGTPGPGLLAAVAPSRAAGSMVRPAEGKARRTVLLTAVDPAKRELAMAALDARGYTVLDAGPQPLLALRFAQEHPAPIDLLLVDVELRLMNGERLVQQLVSHRPSAKVLLIPQASAPRPTIPAAFWLPTPCGQEDLAMRVRQVLESETKADGPAQSGGEPSQGTSWPSAQAAR